MATEASQSIGGWQIDTAKTVYAAVVAPKSSSKFEKDVWEILEESRMRIVVHNYDQAGQPTHVTISVQGPAARVPSVSNSRLNWFPKAGILKLLSSGLIKDAIALLNRTRVVASHNPEHRVRLEALSRLFAIANTRGIGLLRCDKENRWLVTLHCHKDLSRVDTHNLNKSVCDWLQRIGLVENDKHVDCFPTRNQDWPEVAPNQETFVIAMRLMSEVKSEISSLIRAMLP